MCAGRPAKNRYQSPVGASLLAMGVSDDESCLVERGALTFFASRLAPTKNGLACIFFEL
ncbi:hypothetical protein EMIT0P74_80298 [Pseudomonas sp. IT-P74]